MAIQRKNIAYGLATSPPAYTAHATSTAPAASTAWNPQIGMRSYATRTKTASASAQPPMAAMRGSGVPAGATRSDTDATAAPAANRYIIERAIGPASGRPSTAGYGPATTPKRSLMGGCMSYASISSPGAARHGHSSTSR